MIYKSPAIVLVTALSLLYAAPKISPTVKSFHSMTKNEEFVNALRLLGTPDSVLKKYSALEFAGALELMEKPGTKSPLFTKAHFARAETFRENLDSDSAKEYVSQVIFATGSDKLDRKTYFFFVHDDDANNNALKCFKVFDEMLCDHTPSSPMTFGFIINAKEDYKNIEIKIVRCESCGEQISYYNVNDTLEFNGKVFSYRQGKAFGAVHINRSDELQEMNSRDEK
jgi:hypothetical protein